MDHARTLAGCLYIQELMPALSAGKMGRHGARVSGMMSGLAPALRLRESRLARCELGANA